MAPVIKHKPKKSPKKAENTDAKEVVVSEQLQKKINKKKPPQPKKGDRDDVLIKGLQNKINKKKPPQPKKEDRGVVLIKRLHKKKPPQPKEEDRGVAFIKRLPRGVFEEKFSKKRPPQPKKEDRGVTFIKRLPRGVFEKKINKKKPPHPKKEDRGVAFIKRLPRGVFEEKFNKKRPPQPKKEDRGVTFIKRLPRGVFEKKLNKKKPPQPKKEDRGVVFIKNLPRGCFEDQLRSHFYQFGKVTRLRLARCRRTGSSKGYAFVEFEKPEVAQVAAETTEKSLVFKKLSKTTYIPPEKQQYNYFISSLRPIKHKSGKTIWVSSQTSAIQKKVKTYNDWSEENFNKRNSKQLEKLRKLGKKYADLGIDINAIVIEPKIKSADEMTADSSEGEKESDQKKSKTQPKLEDLVGNTIQENSEDEDYIAVPGDDAESDGDQSSDEDLVGNTIQEDSEDEDYIAVPGDDAESDGDQSSDEESYGFLKDAAEEDNSDEGDDDAVEEESPVKNVKKPNFTKSLKSSNIERFDQMLKRKPHTGRIQKSNKKPPQKTVTNKSKNKMQLSAAKEVAKPLSKVQGKVCKGAKPLKKYKKVK